MDASHSQGSEVGPGRLSRRSFLRGVAATGGIAAGSFALGQLGPAGLAAASADPEQNMLPRRGGDLRAGLAGGSGADTLDALRPLTYLDSARAQQLYDALLQMNDQAQIKFQLAESITPEKANREWIIRLRPDVTFHNGKDLTADDVIFTFQTILDPKNPTAGATSLGPMDVKGLKKLDKLTVKVPMNAPFGSFLDQLTYWYYLFIIPVGYNPRKPVGTGPFKYESFEPGRQSRFVRNENYWKPGLPYLDSVTTIDFSDDTALYNALVSGEVDAAGALQGAQIKSLRGQGGIKTVVSPSGQITPFTMRVDRAPFNDVRVRQAMRLIVNRGELIDAAFDSFALKASDVFSPWDPAFDKGAFHREQDIPKAKALLKAAGHENLTTTVVTSAVTTGTIQMATVLAQQATAAGVTIKLDVVDPTTFFGPNYLHWTFSQDYYNYSPYLAQVAQSFLPGSPYNETHWCKPGPAGLAPKYIRLYNEANATTDTTRRYEIEHEMQMIDYNEGGYIIPCFPSALDAYSSKVKGFSPTKVGQPFSNFAFAYFWMT